MNYTELKERQLRDFDEFEGIFFAFNDSQFSEGLTKVGLTTDDYKGNLQKLPGGGFIRRSRIKAFTDMISRHNRQLADLKTDRKRLVDALAYELANHEYCITGNPRDAMDALRLSEEELPEGVLRKAIALAYKTN